MAAAFLATPLLVACDPPPPRPVITVTTGAAGSDVVPGDGVCEATAGAGDCTLRAALQEASALGVADISVPDGDYTTGTVTVDGSIRVNLEARQISLYDSSITVAPDASLELVRIDSSLGGDPSVPGYNNLVVGGTLVLVRSSLVDIGQPALHVGPEGTAVLDTTQIRGLFESTVLNEGTLVLRRSTFVGMDGPALSTTGEGRSVAISSLLFATRYRQGLEPVCTGTAPESSGYVMASDASCALTGPTDLQDVEVTIPDFGVGAVPEPPLATSPLIDAIPAGDASCPAGGTDVIGAPRPVDGDGDGVSACDVGAVERPPS